MVDATLGYGTVVGAHVELGQPHLKTERGEALDILPDRLDGRWRKDREMALQTYAVHWRALVEEVLHERVDEVGGAADAEVVQQEKRLYLGFSHKALTRLRIADYFARKHRHSNGLQNQCRALAVGGWFDSIALPPYLGCSRSAALTPRHRPS